MARIVGLLFSGFMVRAYAVALAIWTAHYVGTYVVGILNQVGNALS